MSELNFDALSEGIQQRSVRKERQKLVEKWEKTRLLDGLEDRRSDQARSNMAQLLENQTAQLITEASSESNIKGFQSIAFPIVRRVFGGLIANELVSVQPMSLPSGLLFYLDYAYGTAKAGTNALDWSKGGLVHGDQIAPGSSNLGTGGHYYLNSSYSARELTCSAPNLAGGAVTWDMLSYDFELSASVANNTMFYADVGLTSSGYTLAQIDPTNYKQFSISGSDANWLGVKGVYRRHNTYNANTGVVRVFYSASSAMTASTAFTASFVTATGLTVDNTGVVNSPAFESDFSPGAGTEIPELDIKVQSVSVTAQSRKLKAKWTPEMAQDLQAYQNLDAELELTQILAEYIAIDIDREILTNLLTDATGAVMYWSRKPGNFVNKLTGLDVTGGQFTGIISDWYQTLLETITDCANVVHRKTLRGKCNFIVCSPDVATILESMVTWRPNSVGDPLMNRFTMGIERIGEINQSYVVYKDPYFPRNIILLGYKGNSFLESGYVYAPYIPLITTPVVYGVEDFTPRKGVMTRYGKRMIRTDMYAKIIIKSMDVI